MLVKIFIMSFWTIGFCCTFWEGMIFEKIGNYLDARLPEYLAKPIYACYICACFWWGSAIYFLFFYISMQEWFLCTISAMGFNAALSKLFYDG
jgi:hypothetical protein